MRVWLPIRGRLAIQRRLEAIPDAERTRQQYERALDAYRAVYHGDPASPDAARSIAAVADLLAERRTLLPRCEAIPRCGGAMGIFAAPISNQLVAAAGAVGRRRRLNNMIYMTGQQPKKAIVVFSRTIRRIRLRNRHVPVARQCSGGSMPMIDREAQRTEALSARRPRMRRSRLPHEINDLPGRASRDPRSNHSQLHRI